MAVDVKNGFKKHYVLIGWAIIWVLFLFLALVLPAVTYEGTKVVDGVEKTVKGLEGA